MGGRSRSLVQANVVKLRIPLESSRRDVQSFARVERTLVKKSTAKLSPVMTKEKSVSEKDNC